MLKENIAKKYLEYLENGEIEQLIDLFSVAGIVDSPIYGIQKANTFYHTLSNDTSNSKLLLKGIFEQKDSNDLALYFTYHWTLKNNREVVFDVVDIIEFDKENKIKKLKIIYDTVVARNIVAELNKNE